MQASRDKPCPPVSLPRATLLERRNRYGILLGLFVFLCVSTAALFYGHFRETVNQLSQEDRSTAVPMALVVEEYLGKTAGVMSAYAQRPRLVQALVARNEEQAQGDLAELMRRLTSIESLIITDREGTLWTRYPYLAGLAGSNYAHRDWYKGARKTWKPYVSEVYARVVGEKDLAVNLVVPFFNRDKKPIGLLAATLRLTALGQMIDQVPLAEGVSVHVTDRNGHLLYSNRIPYRGKIASYPYSRALAQAKPGVPSQTMVVEDPDKAGSRRYIAVSPIGWLGGYVCVERTGGSILSASLPHFLQMGVISLLIFLLTAYILHALSRQAETRQALERLKADRVLEKSEARYHQLFNHISNGVAVYEAREGGEDFILLALNEAARRMTDLQNDPVGKSVCEVFPGVRDFGLFAVFQQVWRTGQPASHPVGLYHDDRFTFWARNDVYKLPSGEVVAVFEDVTDQKRAQMALQQSERQYRLLTEKIPDLVWILNLELRTLYVSPSILRALGFTPEERLRQPVEEQLTPASLSLAIEALAREMARENEPGTDPERTVTLTLEYYHKDGSTRWMETILSALRDEKGELSGIQGISRDVTQRLQAEAALQKQDLLLQKLSAHLPGMIYQFMKKPDGSYGVPFSSEAIRDCFGCSPEEVREDFTPILQALHPEDRERVLASIEASAAGMTVWECEYRVQLPGQPVRWMRGHATPERLDDGSMLWHGYNSDHTNQKEAEKTLRESEERYRRLTGNMADVIWTTDLELRTIYVSPSVERLLGEPAQAHRQRTMAEKFPPEALAQIRQVLAEELAKESDLSQDPDRSRILRVQHYRADGSLIWLSMNVSIIRDESGQAIGVQGVSRDASQFVQAEEAIRRNEARLEGLLRITHHPAESIQALLDYALEEAIELTESRIGYIYLYDDRKREFQLNTWSRGVMAECTILNPQTVYELDKTGIWGEAVRQGKAIVVNDFPAPHPLKKGYPEGHAPLYKFLTVPVFQDDKIVAVAGVANKATDYNDSDVRQLTLLMDAVWRITERKKAELARQEAEERIRLAAEEWRTTFDSITDMVSTHDADYRIQRVNKAFAKAVGIAPDALVGRYCYEVVHCTGCPGPDQCPHYKTIETGKPSSLELYEPRLGLHLELSTSPIRNEQEVVIGSVHIAKDITARKRAEWEEAIISEIGRIIYSTLKIDEVYEQFAREARQLIPFDRLTVNLIDRPAKALRLAYMSGMAVADRKPGDMLPLEGSISEELARTKEGMIVGQAQLAEQDKTYPAAGCVYHAGFRALMDIPLISRDEVIGTLAFRSKTPGLYTQRDLALAQRIGNQVAGAIANAQMHDNLKRAEREMGILAEIGRIISSTLDINEVYERFAADVRQLIPFDGLSVNLLTAQTDRMEIAYATGLAMPKMKRGKPLPLHVHGTLAEAILQSRTGVIIQPQSTEELASRFPLSRLSIRAGIRSVLGVPLISSDQTVGALIFRSRTVEAYGERDLHLAERIGSQIVGAMLNARLYGDVQRAERSLRESERRYRELVELLPIAVFEMSPEGKLLSFNRTTQAMFGYGTRHQLLAIDGSQLVLPEERERLLKDLAGVLNGSSSLSLEYRFLRKDGTTFVGLASASRILRNGRPVGIRGTIADITDRLVAIAELQKTKEQLLQSEKLAALGRLSAGVAHEILNPVNVISMALQMLLSNSEVSAKAKEKVGICLEQTHRIVAIAEDLSQFSRIKEKRLALGHIADPVNHILELISPQLKVNGIKTEVHWGSDLPATLLDASRIEQVLLNLVTNAADAMEGKKEKVLRITIDREKTKGEKDCLKVAVADTGSGIRGEDLDRLFEPFFTNKPPGKGTGLGLSISFGIIEDHGGRIWAENNEAGGATFSFEIPVVKDGIATAS